jgi:hypothetical protein
MVLRAPQPFRAPPSHHIDARPCRQPDHKAAPQSGRGEAPAVVPHPPTPGGGWRRAGRCSQLLSDAKHPQHPRNGFWLGRNPLKKCPLELHIKFRGLYTSSLGIHCAVSVQGVRQGVNQEVRLKARKVRVMSTSSPIPKYGLQQRASCIQAARLAPEIHPLLSQATPAKRLLVGCQLGQIR